MFTDSKKIYGLLGLKLGHSFSETYFNQKFANENINAEYRNFEISDISHITKILAEYDNLAGLNVTIPYKEAVIPFLDELDDDARAIGAVNVIKIIRSGNNIKLKGYNSDMMGFVDSVSSQINEKRKAALILGTGGAAKAIAYGLNKLGVAVQFVSRHKSEKTVIYEELTKDDIKSHKIIVNTTPLGMYPNSNSCPDIPYRFLSADHLCYDLIYNPDETLFMKKAKEAGAETKNGLEMLLLQAFASYQIWNSLR
ncbi:MAG: shikimate dehydrogenase [Bacteroidales bacterium]|nr:shikimate dehydrogenase [Bacteroidales bacterium]